MTAKQWVTLVFACAALYLIPKHLPSPSGAGWFNYQALWSTAAIFIVLKITTSKPAIIIALAEFSIIITNTLAYTGYVGDGGVFYAYCLEISDLLNLTIAFVLVIGAPWDGLADRFKHMGLGHLLRSQDHSRRLPHLRSHR